MPFRAAEGGGNPQSRVVFGPDGSLCGTTVGGEGNCPGGCGTVFNLTPPSHVSGSIFSPWNETLIYRFHGPDEGYPTQGDLIFDSYGSIYGATSEGGDQLCNAPFRLRNGLPAGSLLAKVGPRHCCMSFTLPRAVSRWEAWSSIVLETCTGPLPAAACMVGVQFFS